MNGTLSRIFETRQLFNRTWLKKIAKSRKFLRTWETIVTFSAQSEYILVFVVKGLSWLEYLFSGHLINNTRWKLVFYTTQFSPLMPKLLPVFRSSYSSAWDDSLGTDHLTRQRWVPVVRSWWVLVLRSSPSWPDIFASFCFMWLNKLQIP